MLSYIRLKNFKSFSDIMFDLRGKYGIPKEFACIYGENGVGKSNLISSLLFLRKTTESIKNQARAKQFIAEYTSKTDENKLSPTLKNEYVNHIIKSQLFDMKDLIEEYKTLDSEGTLDIEVGFFLNGVEGTYMASFDATRVVYETLRYTINERMGTFFELTEDDSKLSRSIFFDSAYRRKLEEQIKKYWGKHTFMSILDDETFTKNGRFIASRIHQNMLNVLFWFQTYTVLCRQTLSEIEEFAVPFQFLSSIEKGIVRTRDDKELIATENALNKFFTSLFFDVKQVYYKFEPQDHAFGYKLYFKKFLHGKTLDIPFELESTGTRKLLSIFPYIFSSLSGAPVFIDNIDGGIHDLLIGEVVERLAKALISSPYGQVVATAHSTSLMERLKDENVYILTSDDEGNNDISSLDEYDVDTQTSHSVRSGYLNGDYGGITCTGYLDLSEMVNEVFNYIEEN
ncbi:MAG TPA: AAA family ATPase [Sphaerochaeta sp.]|nr:AAA family ATPase [Sphaerochaeta sp.]HPY45101.1 AAA family ATPase [Sphaerochaeta sp.]HQB04943.1 AAA family ATPase [Sphaerochaeta sp.]